MGKIVKYASIDALGTALYVIVVASFIYLAGQSALKDVESVFIPIAMLMLLVFSVAFVGSLMFGRPVMWYVDGKKREALALLAYTLGIFLIILIGVFLLLIVFVR